MITSKNIAVSFFAKEKSTFFVKQTIPPNGLIGSESNALSKAVSLEFDNATAQGVKCFTITQEATSKNSLAISIALVESKMLL